MNNRSNEVLKQKTNKDLKNLCFNLKKNKTIDFKEFESVYFFISALLIRGGIDLYEIILVMINIKVACKDEKENKIVKQQRQNLIREHELLKKMPREQKTYQLCR